MILEQLLLVIDLVLILILVYHTFRYRNWLVALTLMIGTVGLTTNEEGSLILEVLRQINIGLLVYILYDYMKTKVVARAVLQEQHWGALMESSDYAIIGTDLDGTVLSWNKAAERLFGYSADYMKGQNIRLLMPDHKPDEQNELYERLARGEYIDSFRTERRRSDGSTVVIELTIAPVRDPIDNKIIGASAISKAVQDYE